MKVTSLFLLFFFLFVPFVQAENLFIGSSRYSSTADTSSSMVFRANCPLGSFVTQLGFYGGTNSNSGSITASISNGDSTTVTSVSVSQGDSSTANRARLSSTFSPIECTNGYFDVQYYRSGIAVTLSYASTYANGVPTTFATSTTNMQFYCTTSCGTIGLDSFVSIFVLFTYATQINGSGGGSSDMSTSTLEYVIAPLNFALGIFLFLFSILVWFTIVRRNKK